MTKQLRPIQDADLVALPGADIVRSGLKELRGDTLGESALLVLIASLRLMQLGLEVPTRNDIAGPWEHKLYSLLETTHREAAYSRYNSLLRRMASFVHCLEQQVYHAL